MKSETIAKALRYYRKKELLSVQDVALLLKKHNICVSSKTIYSWENGTTKPDVPTLMVLCSLYHIPNIQQVLGASAENCTGGAPVMLTEDELQLLEQYRRHPEMQAAVRKLLE